MDSKSGQVWTEIVKQIIRKVKLKTYFIVVINERTLMWRTILMDAKPSRNRKMCNNI